MSISKSNQMIAIYTLLFVAACGGGGGTSSDDNARTGAVIEATNEENLATAATEGVIQAYKAGLLNKKTLNELIGVETCSSGSITDNYNSSTGSGSIVYTLCDTSTFVYDGTVNISLAVSGDIASWALNYGNFQIDSTSIQITAACETTISTDTTSCSFSTTSTGLDSRSYNISNAIIEGSLVTGYTVSANIEDPDHGDISISTESPVYIFSCADHQPSSGEIRFTDGNSRVVSITFDSCAGYTVSYDGASNSYTW